MRFVQCEERVSWKQKGEKVILLGLITARWMEPQQPKLWDQIGQLGLLWDVYSTPSPSDTHLKQCVTWKLAELCTYLPLFHTDTWRKRRDHLLTSVARKRCSENY